MKKFYAILMLLLMQSGVHAAVRDVKAEFRKGKTYITFTQESGSGKTYRVYRSKAPILSVAELEPVATVRDSSSWNRDFLRSFATNTDTISYRRYYYNHYVICDSGAPLSDSTGLFVYTPHDTADVYYAVTVLRDGVEDKNIQNGINALSTALHETYWPWPGGVIQKAIVLDNWIPIYSYFYWMDYAEWPNAWDNYGDAFMLTVYPTFHNPAKPVPLEVVMHACCQDSVKRPVPPVTASMIGVTLHAEDHYNDFWFGRHSKVGVRPVQAGDTMQNYTERRVVYYTHAIMNEPFFKIDTNRVYASGGSMGGSGSMTIAYHNPSLFAAVYPAVGRVHFRPNGYSEGLWAAKWGTMAMDLKTPQGISVYKWMDLGWLAENYLATDFPPILNSNGAKDLLHPMYIHTYLYQALTANHQGIWGGWNKSGHGSGAPGGTPIDTEIVSGGLARFTKSEPFPAMSRSTADDRYGTLDSAQMNVSNPVITIDSLGFMNSYVDWSSTLHHLNRSRDTLIDSRDSLAFTFVVRDVACSTCTKKDTIRVDITPRRLHRFSVTSGTEYQWKNISLSTEAVISTGTVRADTNGLLTVPRFLVTRTGNALVLSAKNTIRTEEDLLTTEGSWLTVHPNPFNPETRISFFSPVSGVSMQLTVYDMQGRKIQTLLSGKSVLGVCSLVWNGAQMVSGVYCLKFEYGKRVISKKMFLSR